MLWCSFLHLHLEGVERRFKSCSDEHDWFSPYLTRNTRGWWCLNITGGFNYSEGLSVHNWSSSGSFYPPYTWRLIKYVYDRTFSASVWHTSIWNIYIYMQSFSILMQRFVVFMLKIDQIISPNVTLIVTIKGQVNLDVIKEYMY